MGKINRWIDYKVDQVFSGIHFLCFVNFCLKTWQNVDSENKKTNKNYSGKVKHEILPSKDLHVKEEGTGRQMTPK